MLSGGRLEFGVGRGSIPSQFHGFRIPVAENRARFDEALRDHPPGVDAGALQLSTGTFYQVEDLAVVPRPMQQPHPPIRVAVHTPESFAHIARHRAADLLGHDDHAAAAAARVHGALPRAASPPPAMRGATTRWR